MRLAELRPRAAVSVGVVLVALALVAGCGEDEDAAGGAQASTVSDWQAGAAPEWKQVLAEAQKEGELVLDASPELPQSDFAEEFRRDTGIELKFAAGEGTQRRIAVDQEARANKLRVDISLGAGVESVTMLPDGLLKPIEPQLHLPRSSDPEHWEDGRLKWIDEEGKYVLQASQYVWGWVVVNTDEVEGLDSWDDLLDPRYRGKIMSYDISTPGSGLTTAAFFLEALGEDFVRDLYAGQQVRYSRNRRQLVEAVARGSAAIALGATQADVESFREQGIPIAGVLPQDGPAGLVGGSSVLKQPQNANGEPGPHPNAATVFINWYLSEAGQEAYNRAMLEISRRTDVGALEGVPEFIVPEPDREYVDMYGYEWWSKKYRAALEQLPVILG